VKKITVSRSLFARLIGTAEDLKDCLINACEGFDEDEQISEEEIAEWEALLAEANEALEE
jgi:hypothetical protein